MHLPVRLILRLQLLAGLAVLAALVGPPPARAAAGTYVDMSCATGAGRADSSGGWLPSINPVLNGVNADDQCPSGGLHAQMQPGSGYSEPITGFVGWGYQAPPDTYITRFVAQLGGWLRAWDGNNRGLIDVRGNRSGRIAGYFDSGANATLWPNPVGIDSQGLNDTTLHVAVWCDGPNGYPSCPGGVDTGWMALFGPQVYLADDAPPTTGAVTGSFKDDSTWKGTEHLAYAASDKGGGIAGFRLYVDGAKVIDHVVDTNGGHCSALGTDSTGAWVFGWPHPCPASVDVSESIDTTTIADGTHTLSARVVDVAQRETTLFSAARLVANHPPVNTAAPAYDTHQNDPTLPHVGTAIAVVDHGTWTGPNLQYTQGWEQCDAAGANCAQIAGATGLSYAPTAADIGHRLRFAVTATNAADSVTAYSPLSGSVQAQTASTDPITLQPAPGANGTDGSKGSDGSSNVTVIQVPTLAPPPAGAEHVFIGHIAGEPAGATCPGDRATLLVQHLRGGRMTLGYGHGSRATVQLTCSADGKAITGARLDVATLTVGSKASVASDLTTDGNGRATVRIPRGPSRGITVGYRMFADDALARATATVRVGVLGRVALRSSRRRLRNGQAVVLRGRLAGGYVPRRGVNLAVQWKDGKRWRPFAQVKSDRRGGFRYGYRFTRTRGRITYQLRVQVTAGQVDYPYLAVASKPVKVTVAP